MAQICTWLSHLGEWQEQRAAGSILAPISRGVAPIAYAPRKERKMRTWPALQVAARTTAVLLSIAPPPAFASDNKEIARRFVEAFAAGDTATLRGIVAEDVLDHTSPPGTRPGRKGLLDAVDLYPAWFPNVNITVERQIAEGSFVAQFGIVRGTNKGAITGTPATGRAATFAYMDMYRISDGRIVETWHIEDIAGMLSQLGLMHQ